MCSREARGFGIDPKIAGKIGIKTNYCSMRCMDMIDKTTNEIDALKGASQYGGEYFSEQNISVKCSREQWMQFIECVVNGWTETLRETPNETDEEIPF